MTALCWAVACGKAEPAEPAPPSAPPAAVVQPEPAPPPAAATATAVAEPAAPAPAAAVEPAREASKHAPSKPKPVSPPAAAAEPVADAPPKPPAVASATPCGEKGQPRCPLQGWMEDHLQAPLDASDWPALARSLTRVAKLAPDASWNAGEQGWAAIAEAGANAAKQNDAAAAKQACKTCHKAWRAKYKASFRSRTVSD